MKKTEAIQKVKEGTHAIEMNRKEPKHIDLLREICKEAFPNDDSKPYGSMDFYEKMNRRDEWDYHYDTNKQTIKITEIEQEETFESGELVEVSNNEGVSWVQRYFIGYCRDGNAICEGDDCDLRYWELIRKINPAIEQIREIMKKNNISKEQI
jgi:hypothetical protein